MEELYLDKPVAQRIRVGQPIWMGEHIPSQRNGIIAQIDREDETVIAIFPNRLEREISFETLECCWRDSLGGYWHVES